MAKVFNRISKVFLKSVHTPDYSSNPEWLIDPDLSLVEEIPQKYWKVIEGTGDGYNDGYGLFEMSQFEKATVDSDQVNSRLRNLKQRIISFGTPHAKVASTSWETIGRFAHLGQESSDNIMTRFYLTAHQTSGGLTDVRIYDITNAKTIVILTDFNDLIPTIKDLGAPNFLPLTQAVFEIQAKVSNQLKPAYISSLVII